MNFVDCDDQDQPLTPKRAKLRQRNLSKFGVSTDSATWEKLDEQIAKLFFACNLPFNIADNPIWRETVEMLRPGYCSPNRKDTGGSLLDRIHEKITKEMKSHFQGQDAVLVQDGWSDIHNSPIFASSLHMGGKSFFLSAVKTGTNKKTAQYCTDIALSSISDATELFDCNISGFVSDNEKKMQVMKSNLKQTNPEMTVYGCSCHWLNLVGQEVTPVQVINQIVEINKNFRNHHIPGALLREMSGSVKPQLPCDTRWNSQLHGIETFLRNRPYMLLIAAQHEDVIELCIRNLIQNIGLANEAKHLNSQLSPVLHALDSLQSDSASIADACEVWTDLLQEEDLAPYLKTVNKRFDQAMIPSHFLAHIMHPRYRGKKLKSSQITYAQDMLQEESPELVADLVKFMCDDAILPKSLTNETTIKDVSPSVCGKVLKN